MRQQDLRAIMLGLKKINDNIGQNNTLIQDLMNSNKLVITNLNNDFNSKHYALKHTLEQNHTELKSAIATQTQELIDALNNFINGVPNGNTQNGGNQNNNNNNTNPNNNNTNPNPNNNNNNNNNNQNNNNTNPNNNPQNGGNNNNNNMSQEDWEKFITKKDKNWKVKSITYIYEGIKSAAKASFSKWVEIDDKVHKVGRTIGMTGTQARAMVEDITNNYGDMADRLGMSFEEIFKFQESYNKSIGRGTILANEQVEAMAGLSKIVGDTAVEDVVKNMDDLGASTDTATLYLTQNMARARAHGLDAKKTSEAFANNIKLASKYTFREGVNGISKMTLLSQKLKFNMDSIANAAEKFETIEGAIGTAANLQMLGGSFAAQFGNPLEAMNMAMLDMEGFTNKIIDTFNGKAVFNRETGQVEMSALDKRFLKEAAKQLGIGYEEAWNMASQSAKINDIERSLNPSQTFTEEQKALIANKSIFKDGKHQITFYGEDNEKITKGVDQLTAADLKFLTDETTTEIAMADDVHSIKKTLEQYLGKSVRDTKSEKEIYQGKIEKLQIEGANAVDGVMNHEGFRNAREGLNPWLYGGLLVGANVLGNWLNNRTTNSIDKWFSKNKGGGNGASGTGTTTPPSGNPPSGNPPGGNPPGGNPPGGGPNAKPRTRAQLRRLAKAKNVVKGLGKKVPYIGTALALADGVMSSINAHSKYEVEKSKIENSDLSAEEKTAAKTQAKRERNESYGGAAVGTAGALAGAAGGAKVGAAIGTLFGPIGTAVGGLLGGAIGGSIGYFAGEGVGKSVGGALTSAEKVEGEDKAKTKTPKSEEINVNNVILSQIRDINQQIYDLLLNSKSLVSEASITNLSSVDNNVIKNASQNLAINKNDIYQENTYSNQKGGYKLINNQVNNETSETYNDKISTSVENGIIKIAIKIDGQNNNAISKNSVVNGDNMLTVDNKNYINGNAISKNSIINGDNMLYTPQNYYDNGLSSYYNNIGGFNINENNLVNNKSLSFNDKINTFISDFTSKASFNRETNQYEMTPHDKKVMYEAARQLGIDNEGIWEMVSQNIKNNYINSSDNIYSTFSNDSFNINESNSNSSNIMRPYNYSLLNNISPKDISYNNDITPKVTVGLETPIKQTSFNRQGEQSYNNNIGNNKFDLNVSGSIKLTTDRGVNAEIDMNKLLNNTEFMNNLINIISENFNKRVNGQRENKNSVLSLQNGGYGYNQLNSTTNGWII